MLSPSSEASFIHQPKIGVQPQNRLSELPFVYETSEQLNQIKEQTR